MNRNNFEKNFDLALFLEEEGIKFNQNHSHIFLSECPNCNGRDKLFIDKITKLWVCYKCCETDNFKEHKEGRGNLWTLLLSLGNSLDQVKSIYNSEKSLTYVSEIDENEEPVKEKPKKEKIEIDIPKYLTKLDCSEFQIRNLKEAYLYLWNRHIKTREQYEKFNIHYNILQKRIVFPAIDCENKVIGLQSRDITNRYKTKHYKCHNHFCSLVNKFYFTGEQERPEVCLECSGDLELSVYPKSINTRDFPKTEFFFNEQNVDWKKPVVLVEGPFDAINVKNSLAFLGKSLSETQFNILLRNLKSDLILYLDGDKAGDISTYHIYKQLSPFFNIKIVLSYNEDDPGSFSIETNDLKIQEAVIPYKWLELKGFNSL